VFQLPRGLQADCASPQHLIDRAKTGDNEALGSVFKYFEPTLKQFARAWIPFNIRAKVTVSDLVQDTFLHAHQGFAEFRGTRPAELGAWLRHILDNSLRNLARNYRSGRKRQIAMEREGWTEREAQTSRTEQPLLTPLSPCETAIRHESDLDVDSAIARLDDELQNLIQLRFFQRKSFPQIGEQLGVTSEAARKLVNRAIQRVATTLKGIEG
jgi:RNA polymerase sigma-70 factor (ECF subfamily)